MFSNFDRRRFMQSAAVATAGLAMTKASLFANAKEEKQLYDISLAQWSLNKKFFNFLKGNGGADSNALDPQDFAIIAKNDFGIEAVEYVNQFYADAVKDPGYLKDLKKKSEDAGVRNVLIMVDREGELGDPNLKQRITAVRNHIKWLEWAAELGCHAIRVNASSRGTYEEQQKLAADGLHRLAEIGDTYDLNVIVENHGGLSSHGRWLATVMEMADHPRCGTLPDFGNFFINRGGNGQAVQEYDRYLGTSELMPYAKGVSAKTYAFDDQGNETATDFDRIMKIVLDAGYRGYVGIEFEGNSDPYAGIKATKALLEKVRTKFTNA